MAISYITSSTAGNEAKSASTSISFTTPIALLQGDTIVVGVALDYNPGTISMTAITGVTWREAGQVSNTGGSTAALFFGYITAVAGLSSGTTVEATWGSNVTAQAIYMYALRGAASTASGTSTTISTSNTPGATINSGQASGDWAALATAWEGPIENYNSNGTNTTIRITRGTTGQGAASNQSGAGGHTETVNSGAMTATHTLTTSRDWAAVLGALKPDTSVTVNAGVLDVNVDYGSSQLHGVWYAGEVDPTIAVRGSFSGVSNNSTTIAVTKPTGTVEGDLMIAAISAMGNDISEPTSSGWTAITGSPFTDGNTSSITYYFYKYAGASEGASYTWTGSFADDRAGQIVSLEGADSSTPTAPTLLGSELNGSPGGSGATLTPTSGGTAGNAVLTLLMSSVTSGGSGAQLNYINQTQFVKQSQTDDGFGAVLTVWSFFAPLTGGAPQIGIDWHPSFTPSYYGAAHIQIPKGTASGSVIVHPGVVGASLSLDAVTVSGDASVSVGLLDINAAVLAPTFTSPVTVSVGSLSLTAAVGSVTVTGHALLSQGVQSLTGALGAVTVRGDALSNVNYAGWHGDFTLYLEFQTNVTGARVDAGVLPVVAAVSSPTFTLGALVDAGAQALATAVHPVTVQTASPVVVDVGVLSLSAAVAAPTLVTDQVLTQGVQALAAAVASPTLVTDQVLTQGVQALTAAIAAPTAVTDQVLTQAAQALTAAVAAPTVTTDQVLTQGVQALTAAVYSATVDAVGNVTFVATARTVALSGGTVTVRGDALSNVNFAGWHGDFTLYLEFETIVLGALVDAGVEALTVAPLAATPVTSQVLTQGVVGSTLTLYAATVATQGNVTFIPTASTVALASGSTTVVTDQVLVQGAQSLTAAVGGATASGAALASSGVLPLAASVAAPSITGHAVVAQGAQAATLAVYAATVSAAGNVTFAATASTVALSGGTASVVGDALVSTGSQAAVVAALAASASSDTSVSVGSLALASAVASASVVGAASVPAGLLDFNVAVLAATQTNDAVVTVGAQSLAAGVGSTGVSLGAILPAGVLAGSFALHAPVVTDVVTVPVGSLAMTSALGGVSVRGSLKWVATYGVTGWSHPLHTVALDDRVVRVTAGVVALSSPGVVGSAGRPETAQVVIIV